MEKIVKYEMWQEQFAIAIMAFREGKWIGEQIATIPFDFEDSNDVTEKIMVAKIMINALNESVKDSTLPPQ
jgi:hypothetical protein